MSDTLFDGSLGHSSAVAESLEVRRLFAGAAMTGTILVIEGSVDDDNIVVEYSDATRSKLNVTIVQRVGSATPQLDSYGPFTAATVTKIKVDPFGGPDRVDIKSDVTEETEIHGGDDAPDLIYGGALKDTIYGGDGEIGDILYGRGGNDVLEGGEGDDELHGGDSDDTLKGGEGNDQLRGGSGEDRMYGDAGHDHLYGGDHIDRMWGGDGNDRFSELADGYGDIIDGEGHDVHSFPYGDVTYGKEEADSATGIEYYDVTP